MANIVGAFNASGSGGALPNDPELMALAGVTSAADKLFYFTGHGTGTVTSFTSAARSLLDDTTLSAMLTTLSISALSSMANGTVIARRTAGSGVPEAVRELRVITQSPGTITLATSIPQNFTDVSMATFTATGDMLGSDGYGAEGVLAATVLAAGLAATGLAGSGGAADTPYPVATWPGLCTTYPIVRARLVVHGRPATTKDVLSSVNLALLPAADQDAEVGMFMVYVSDGSADHKWRGRVSYRSDANGYENLITPDTALVCRIDLPVVKPAILCTLAELAGGTLITNAAAEAAPVAASRVLGQPAGGSTGPAIALTPEQLRGVFETTQTLTDGATISWDASLGRTATVTLGGNRTLANPTNLVTGGYYCLIVTQDGTGGRTLTVGSTFVSTLLPLRQAISAVTTYLLYYDGSKLYIVSPQVIPAGLRVLTNTDGPTFVVGLNDLFLVSTGATAIAITLPALSGQPKGRELSVVATAGAGTVTLNKTGSDTIGGNSSLLVAAGTGTKLTGAPSVTDWAISAHPLGQTAGTAASGLDARLQWGFIAGTGG